MLCLSGHSQVPVEVSRSTISQVGPFPSHLFRRKSKIHTWWQCLADNLEKAHRQHP